MTEIRIDKSNAHLVRHEIYASGAMQAYYVTFNFSEEWDGLIKKACFKAGDNVWSFLMTEGNTVKVPWEVLTTPNANLEIGVLGTFEDQIIFPTVWCNCGRIAVGTSDGQETKPKDPDIYEQILNIIGSVATTWKNGTGLHSVQTIDSGCLANGDYSVAEGYATIANNPSEHAEGQYNVSNYVDGSSYGNGGNTQHSIGIGADDLNRKNAFEVMQNGDVYLIGVGDYDGTNVSEADTLQEIVSNMIQTETDPTVPAWAKQPNKPNYIASEITDNGTNVAAEISAINEKISPQATSGNKLVSASEMGDAISSVEAKQLYATNTQGSFSTKASLTSATTFFNADGTIATPTKNDVAYILADESHDNKSAKYVVANVVDDVITWGFVITFSDTTFTQAQMDAINSNITNAKRQSYDEHIANNSIHVTAGDKTNWNSKQDAISDLSDIRSGAALGTTAVQKKTTIGEYAYTHNGDQQNELPVGFTGNNTIIKTNNSGVIKIESSDDNKLCTAKIGYDSSNPIPHLSLAPISSTYATVAFDDDDKYTISSIGLGYTAGRPSLVLNDGRADNPPTGDPSQYPITISSYVSIDSKFIHYKSGSSVNIGASLENVINVTNDVVDGVYAKTDDVLQKVSTNQVVYATDTGGSQSTITYSTSNVADSIVRRDANGRVSASDPSSNNDAVNLSYFNSHIPTEMTQAELNEILAIL